MKSYHRVAHELTIIHSTARWNPRLRRILKAAPLVVLFLLVNSRAARAHCSFSPSPDPTADGSSNSLRQAIQMANASGQDCLIQLQAGTYTLTLANTQGHVSDASSGDLNITDSGHAVTIRGQGPSASIVNANGIDRVFQVSNGANAEFRKLTIEGGLAQDDGAVGALPGTTESEGGGLLIQDGGQVTLSHVWVENNRASGANGAHGLNVSGGGVAANGGMGLAALGGGLYVASGTISLDKSTISANSATGGEGGAGGSSTGVSFPLKPSARGGNGGNGATAFGGGLYVASGTIDFEESTISGNLATAGAGGGGGAAGVFPSNLGFFFGGVGGQAQTGSGGGIYVASGTTTLTTSTISGNSATGGAGGSGGSAFGPALLGEGGLGRDAGDGEGGGVYSLGSLQLTRSTVSGNTATGGRGGNGGSGGRPNVNVGGSGGSSQGGGMFIAAGDLSSLNSTFFGNTANTGGPAGFPTGSGLSGVTSGGDSAGGGLFVTGGSIDLVGLTIASNIAKPAGAGSPRRPGSSLGGGIANADATSLVIKDTLVGDNTRDSNSPGAGPDISGVVTSSYSLISQTSGATITDDGGNIFSQNPQLDPNGLQSNGGPTQTVALQSTSPAIDVVPVANCTDLASPPQPLRIDQRGFPRPDFGENVCDIGAFESQETFAGKPGTANCHGVSVSALANQYGGLSAAASALHFPSVQVLQAAIRAFCRE